MRYDWIKEVPGYINYFNEDHRLIIDLISIDNYFILYSYFGKTGIYFPIRQQDCEASNDRRIITELIGENNYQKLYQHFSKSGIYFSSVAINQIKKAWAIKNRHIDYNEAARTLDVSAMTIYRWRQADIVTT
jgi:hypothetical protein